MHSAVDNIKTIVDILQKEIFDRINIKIFENTLMYLKLNELDKLNCGGVDCIQVIFKEDNDFTYEPADLEYII